jgi:hypothetical protein
MFHSNQRTLIQSAFHLKGYLRKEFSFNKFSVQNNFSAKFHCGFFFCCVINKVLLTLNSKADSILSFEVTSLVHSWRRRDSLGTSYKQNVKKQKNKLLELTQMLQACQICLITIVKYLSENISFL